MFSRPHTINQSLSYPFLPTVPTFTARETDVSRHNRGNSGAPHYPPTKFVQLLLLRNSEIARQNWGTCLDRERCNLISEELVCWIHSPIALSISEHKDQKHKSVIAEMWEPTLQGSPHLQSQLQSCYRLTFSWPFSYIYFSSFTFPGTPYRISFLFFCWLPCHFYLAVIEQQQQQADWNEIFYLIPSSNTPLFYSVYCMFIYDSPNAHNITISVLTRVTSPPSSTPRRIPSYLLLTILIYFLFIFHIPRNTLPDFQQ